MVSELEPMSMESVLVQNLAFLTELRLEYELVVVLVLESVFAMGTVLDPLLVQLLEWRLALRKGMGSDR